MATSQASNLTGLLSNIAGTAGKMADPGNQYVDTLRTIMAPQLDMEDPQSMSAYANYLDKNGRKEEAMALRSQAATRKGALRGLDGESQIANIAATINENTKPEDREAKLQRIYAIAKQFEISALSVDAILEQRNITRRDQTVKEGRLTVEEQALQAQKDQFAEDLLLRRDEYTQNGSIAANQISAGLQMNAQDNQTRMDINVANILSESELQRLRLAGAEESQIREIAFKRYKTDLQERGVNTRFDKAQAFNEAQLAETTRMNTAQIYGIKEGVAQKWKGLSLDEQRVATAKSLADNEINMTQFKQMILGDENDRANNMFDTDKALKESQIKVALASAGYTDAQMQNVLYELGYARDTESLRIDALELGNEWTKSKVALTDTQLDLVSEQIKNEREKKGYIQAQIRALDAQVQLGRDEFGLAEKRQAWDMGYDEAKLRLEESRLNAGIRLSDAQVENFDSLIQSRQFADEVIVAQMVSDKVSLTTQAVMDSTSLNLDSEVALNNAKHMWVRQNPGTGADWDAAIAKKIAQRDLIRASSATNALREGNRPATEAELTAAGMAPRDQVVYNAITTQAERNQYLQTWVAKDRQPNLSKPPSQDQMEFWDAAANRLQESIFPSPFGSDMVNKVYDQDVVDEIKSAMAQAANSGAGFNDIMIAGLEATYPYIEAVGDAGPVSNASMFRSKYDGSGR